MFDDGKRKLMSATPSTAVQVFGLEATPEATDPWQVYSDIKTARQSVEKLKKQAANKAIQGYAASAAGGSDVHMRVAIVLKCDCMGSIAAVKYLFNDVNKSKYVNLRWILAAAGPITESDINIAKSCPADADQRVMVVGFNTSVLASAEKMARRDNIEVRTFKVIYELLETVVAAMENALGEEECLTEKGHAEVLAIFKGRDGKVAGCRISDGRLAVGDIVKIYRGNTKVHEGPIHSLRQGPQDVKKAEEGSECGFCIKDWDAWEKGDRVASYELTTVKPQILPDKENKFSEKKKR